MKTLSIYLNECVRNMFEGNAAKDTLIQETLSCFFFDAWFNKHDQFDNNEELAEYYQNRIDIIAQISAITGLTVEDYNAFLLDTNKSGKFTPAAKQWQNSFIYQCESFEKWVATHPSFSHKLTFVHHDSKLGIKDGQVTGNWSIATRVDNGTKKFRISDKDKYQKADIYAVVDAIDIKPEDDINDEVSYWTQAVSGTDGDVFVGISLKKLGKVLSGVHTYGLDQMSLTVDEKSVDLELGIFDNIKIDLANGILSPGTVTSYIHFNIDTDGETKKCDFVIRANNKGPAHAMKDPHVSWQAAATTELKVYGASALGGKASSLVSTWLREKINDCKDKGSNDFIKKIDKINTNLQKVGVHSDIHIQPETAALLDFLAENNTTIAALYKAFEKGPKEISTIQPYLDELGYHTDADIKTVMGDLYASTKWQNISWRILSILEAITDHMVEDGLDQTVLQLYAAAKGIRMKDTDIHLPYVLLGE